AGALLAGDRRRGRQRAGGNHPERQGCQGWSGGGRAGLRRDPAPLGVAVGRSSRSAAGGSSAATRVPIATCAMVITASWGMERGVYARNAVAPLPTLTPASWASIATGATAGTHGITRFTTQHAGDPLGVSHSGFNSAECTAEYLREAAEAVGKRSCVIKWPTAWPPRGVLRGALVDGCHVHDCLHEFDTARLSGYVSINLKGRRPQGIVEPGAEYEATR